MRGTVTGLSRLEAKRGPKADARFYVFGLDEDDAAERYAAEIRAGAVLQGGPYHRDSEDREGDEGQAPSRVRDRRRQCHGTKHCGRDAGHRFTLGDEKPVQAFGFGPGSAGFGEDGRWSKPGLMVDHRGSRHFVDHRLVTVLIHFQAEYPQHLAGISFRFWRLRSVSTTDLPTASCNVICACNHMRWSAFYDEVAGSIPPGLRAGPAGTA